MTLPLVRKSPRGPVPMSSSHTPACWVACAIALPPRDDRPQHARARKCVCFDTLLRLRLRCAAVSAPSTAWRCSVNSPSWSLRMSPHLRAALPRRPTIRRKAEPHDPLTANRPPPNPLRRPTNRARRKRPATTRRSVRCGPSHGPFRMGVTRRAQCDSDAGRDGMRSDRMRSDRIGSDRMGCGEMG